MDKKTLSRREFLCAGAITAAGAILAACRAASTEAPTQAVQQPVEPTATKAAAAPTATQAAAAPVEPTPTSAPEPEVPPEPTPVVNAFGECGDPLIMWHGLTGSDGAVFAEMLAMFAEATPEVCLRSEGIPWDLFFQKYPTAVAAGTPPDLVIFHAAEVNQMASQGLMMSMEDIMFDGTLTKDQFNSNLINQITVEGETMAVPFDNHGWLLYYNKKLLEEAGLPSDPASLPKSGDEFIEWGLQLTVDVNGKHPNEAGFDPDNVQIWTMYPSWPRYTLPSTLWQFGGGVISDDGKKATLDSPQSVAAIQYWHDMIFKYHICPPWEANTTWSPLVYKPNRLVFMWEGTWVGGFMRDNPDVAEITEMTRLNSLSPDGHQAVKFDSHIFSIPVGVNPDGIGKSKKLMLYLLEHGAYWTNAGQVPALLSVQQSPEVQAVKGVRVAAEEFNAIGRTDMAHHAFVELQTAYETACGNALSSPGPIEQALKEGAAQIQAILDRP